MDAQDDSLEQGFRLDDISLQKLLKRGKINMPTFTCQKGHMIHLVCTSARCQQSAFICTECDDKSHHQCQTKQGIDILHHILENGIKNNEAIYSSIYHMSARIIDSIKKNLKSLAADLSYLGLNKAIQDMVESVFVKKDLKWKGCEMFKLQKKLNEKLKSYYPKEKVLAQEIEYKYIEIKRIIEKDLRQIFTIEPTIGYNFHSQIVKEKEEITFIKESLASVGEVASIKLLYRASENGFSAAEFHKKCDNIEHTFTIVRTEFGRTIAGYTPLKWNQVKNNYASDDSQKTFLLQVDLKQKMTLTQPKYAIVCRPDSGPAFGDGSDIFISDKCNVAHQSTYADFPSSYNFQQKPYKNRQTSWSAFSGATKGNIFKVLEYEVFQVQFQKTFNLWEMGKSIKDKIVGLLI